MIELHNGPAPEPDAPAADAERRRALAGRVFVASALVLTVLAVVAAFADGFAGPAAAGALGVALIGANLAPVIAVSGGRIEALTPVGALLVPIGILLPLPEAILTYALGEGLGVVLAHRFDSHVGGPDEAGAVRTGFVVGKSVLGATVGLVAMGAIAGPEAPVGTVLLASLVGVSVSTAADHTILALITAFVQRVRVVPELVRGTSGLLAVGGVEVVVGALIAVLAVRDLWSLVLGLGVLSLLGLVGSAYARARTERQQSQELLALAEQLQHATTTVDVEQALLGSLRRLLPQDPVALQDPPPQEGQQGWQLVGADGPRWLVTPKLVETRDYEQQPRRLIAAAIALTEVALNRAAAQERVVQQDQLRSLVLATVAHDLRSPLATATTALETLAHRGSVDGSEISGQLLGAARRGVDRVRRLMDDLLSLELLENLGGGAGQAPVGPTIEALLDELELGGARVAFEGCSAAAAIDPVSLGRIVENLAVNAAKYSPRDGLVTIRCGPMADPHDAAADGVLIVVEDEGPGVDPEQRHAIFEPFEQAGRARGGSGLGLYVARRFVERCGGRIWVDASDGGGAAFHVWLPAGHPTAVAVAVDQAPYVSR